VVSEEKIHINNVGIWEDLAPLICEEMAQTGVKCKILVFKL
jgi:hypothetical protein